MLPTINGVEILNDALCIVSECSSEKQELALTIVKLLEKYSADINFDNGKALRYAALNGNNILVKYYIDNGVDCHYNNDYVMRMAIHYNQNIDTVDLLLNYNIFELKDEYLLKCVGDINMFKLLVEKGKLNPKNVLCQILNKYKDIEIIKYIFIDLKIRITDDEFKKFNGFILMNVDLFKYLFIGGITIDYLFDKYKKVYFEFVELLKDVKIIKEIINSNINTIKELMTYITDDMEKNELKEFQTKINAEKYGF